MTSAAIPIFRDTLPFNARSDVLTFQTAPLAQALEATSPIVAILLVTSSARDTDFTAKLIDVIPPNEEYPESLAINLTDSILRACYPRDWTALALMAPGRLQTLIFALYPTSNVFKAGRCLRVYISSNFPRFDVNPNTGGLLALECQFALAQSGPLI